MNRTHKLPTRRQAAISFAMVGLIAGTAQVLTSDIDNTRLWREVIPLASLVGAVLGTVLQPCGWRSGAVAAVLALLSFTLTYGVAETAMMAGRGEIDNFLQWPASILHWTGLVLSQAAIGGIAATLAGGIAGNWLRRQGN